MLQLCKERLTLLLRQIAPENEQPIYYGCENEAVLETEVYSQTGLP